MRLRDGWRLTCGVLCVITAIGCGSEPEPGSKERERDPCDPNPCTLTGKTQCEVVDDAAVCGCDDGRAPDGRGGCESVENWSTGVAGNAVDSSGATQYTAHVQVVDSDDQPIEGARLRVGRRAIDTNVEGRAPFPELETGTLTFMSISAEGYVPALRQLSIGNSGMRELVVELVKQGTLRAIDAGQPATLQAGNIDLALPRNAFVNEKGERATGDIQARLTGFVPSVTGERAWPGGFQARNASGQPTMVERWFGAVHAEFKSANGDALQLGPDATAKLTVALPADAEVAAGDEVGLWALDEETGLWMLESSCIVSVVESDSGETKLCTGRASHFSYWAAGSEWDIYSPGKLGCINVTLDVQLPEGYHGATDTILPMECKGDDCTQSVSWNRGQVRYFHETEDRPAGLCGVTAADTDVRVAVAVRVRQQEEADEATIPDGMYVYATEMVDLSSFKDVLGFQLMLNQTFEPESDCRELCKQVEITIDETSLKDLQRLTDEDRDGAWATTAEDSALPWWLGREDCNDTDRNIAPWRAEAPCGGVDFNCDGVPAPDGEVSWRDQDNPEAWNSIACGRRNLTCVLTEEEVRGNAYDEDCDGRVEDRDNDGYLAPVYYDWDNRPMAGETRRDPGEEDCNDYAPTAHPAGEEVAGNPIDEDCDGNWLDFDGDGYFAWGHEFIAFEQLGIDPVAEPEKFGDCDDLRRDAHPNVPVEREVGAFKSLYYETSPGRFIRGPEFCDYFDDNGQANQYVYDRARDLNCDGFVTDMDGDGWTDPRDRNLGAGAAFDCNDLDPRIRPAGTPTVEAPKEPPACLTPPASQLMDASICEVDNGPWIAGCSPLLFEGKSVPTTCTEVIKTEDTMLSMCLFAGWEQTGPLKWKPGLAWGPCDGLGGLLPPCPTGYQCGGGALIEYPPEFKSYLESKYSDGAPIEYEGMCFKTCTE